MKKKLYTPREASKILGVTVTTLQTWDNQGKIKAVRTATNRRMFPLEEIQKITGEYESSNLNNSKYAIYARVSSHEQKAKGDLQRQIDFLLENIPIKNKENILVFSDVGSGLNDKRKGLLKLMAKASKREITHLYIRYKDRLTRFGFNYLEMYMSSHGVKIVILDDATPEKSIQQELIEDLIAIMTSFSGKMHGLRSKKNKILKEKMAEVIDSAIVVSNEDK